VSEKESSKYRDNPDRIAEYLNEAIASDDLATFLRALDTVVRSQNVLALSEETGLRRENLYRSFSGSIDPRLGNTLKILASLGVRVSIKTRKITQAKPLRPKTGPKGPRRGKTNAEDK
jgi:probable addiction module antidote protein